MDSNKETRSTETPRSRARGSPPRTPKRAKSKRARVWECSPPHSHMCHGPEPHSLHADLRRSCRCGSSARSAAVVASCASHVRRWTGMPSPCECLLLPRVRTPRAHARARAHARSHTHARAVGNAQHTCRHTARPIPERVRPQLHSPARSHGGRLQKPHPPSV